MVTPIRADVRRYPRRDKTRKDALAAWSEDIDDLGRSFKVKHLYSDYTASGLKEAYPATEILSRPYYGMHRSECFIRTAPAHYIHILGRLQGRHPWWARWAEHCGRMC